MNSIVKKSRAFILFLRDIPLKLKRYIQNMWGGFIKVPLLDKLGLLLIEIAILLILLGHLIETSFIVDIEKLFTDLYANIGSELIGIAVTVLIIDRLYASREKIRVIDHLIRQMRSRFPPMVGEAAKELKALEVFSDGTLSNRDFSDAIFDGTDMSGVVMLRCSLSSSSWRKTIADGANLSAANCDGAIFSEAQMISVNFTNASLYKADFNGANLSWVDFTGAKMLTEMQLQKANMLWGAIMPDGNRYDGRFDLKGDIEEAFLWNVNYNDPDERKEFYDSSNPVQNQE